MQPKWVTPFRWKGIVASVVIILFLLALLGFFVYALGFDTLTSAPHCEMARDLLPRTVTQVKLKHTKRGYGAYNPSICRLDHPVNDIVADGANHPHGVTHYTHYILACRYSTLHMGDRFLSLILHGYQNSLLLGESINGKAPDWLDLNVNLTVSPTSKTSVEDVRLFFYRHRLYGLGCVFEKNHRNPKGIHQPVLIRFDSARKCVDYFGRFAGLDPTTPNKNWTAIVRNNEILIHRDTFPTFRIDRLVDLCGANRLELLISVDLYRAQPELRRWTAGANKCVRGTSNWCRWSATEWMFVVHTQFFSFGNNIVPIYRSMLVVVDESRNWRVSASSEWLNLDPKHSRIQFASALDINLEKGEVVIGMGLNDRIAAFATYSIDDVAQTLLPCG